MYAMINSEIRRGDIFYTDLGQGVGSEQGGIRPVAIIQNDIGNKKSGTVIVAAITSQLNKSKLPTHIEVSTNCGLKKDSVILLEQIRTLDKRRLQEKIGRLNKYELEKLDNALCVSVGIPTGEHITINSQIKAQIENENNDKKEEKTYSEEMVKNMKNKLKEMESVISNSRKKKACFVIDENVLDIMKCACSIICSNDKNECYA